MATCELELSANLARAHALERSMRSKKNGKASLGAENNSEQPQVQTPEHSSTELRAHSLKASELLIQKVNHNCAEDKAGEYGEKTSNS